MLREPPAGDTAAQRLARASHLSALARRAKGARREELGRRALAAYEDVVTRFPEAASVTSEAAFRAGELRRRFEEDDEALRLFARAREVAPRGPFAHRAAFAEAVLLRDRGSWDPALEVLATVEADESGPRARRERGALEAARTLPLAGRDDAARAAFQRLALRAADPFVLAKAHDEWALRLVAIGDLEGAAGVLARCRDALRDPAAQQTETGRRLTELLEELRCIDALKTAIERRRTDRGDR